MVNKIPIQGERRDLGLRYDDVYEENGTVPLKPQYLVRVTWFDREKLIWEIATGTILKDDIILTYHAPNFRGTKYEGFCLLTYDLSVASGPENVLTWRQAIINKKFRIALIKLETKINLNSQFLALEISERNSLPKQGEIIIIFSWFDNKPVYTIAELKMIRIVKISGSPLWRT